MMPSGEFLAWQESPQAAISVKDAIDTTLTAFASIGIQADPEKPLHVLAALTKQPLIHLASALLSTFPAHIDCMRSFCCAHAFKGPMDDSKGGQALKNAAGEMELLQTIMQSLHNVVTIEGKKKSTKNMKMMSASKQTTAPSFSSPPAVDACHLPSQSPSVVQEPVKSSAGFFDSLISSLLNLFGKKHSSKQVASIMNETPRDMDTARSAPLHLDAANSSGMSVCICFLNVLSEHSFLGRLGGI